MRKKREWLQDPVVEAVREAGREIEREAGGDLGRFFQILARTEQRYRERIARPRRGRTRARRSR